MNIKKSKQRAFLRSMAHHLSPLVFIGKEGITGGLLDSVKNSFNTHELVKIKVLENAPESSSESAKILLSKLEEAELVQVIGRMVILYRMHPSNPKIELPL